MLDSIVIRENWLTRKPLARALPTTLLLATLLCAASLAYLRDFHHAGNWMPASADAVFTHREYWRAWSALFAHEGPLHLLSNLFLFVPLTFWLTGYFSLWFFPLAGFLIMGLVNFLVLKTMPAHTELLGVSGVVYWMGSAWLTLYLLVDRRHGFKRRFATAISLIIMLLIPETYTPEVSYFSHLFGFIAGIPSALALFYLFRHKFQAAELREFIFDEEIDAIPDPAT